MKLMQVARWSGLAGLMILVAWWMPDYLHDWSAFAVRNILIPALATFFVARFTTTWPESWLRTKRILILGTLLLLFAFVSIHTFAWRAYGNWRGYWGVDVGSQGIFVITSWWNFLLAWIAVFLFTTRQRDAHALPSEQGNRMGMRVFAAATLPVVIVLSSGGFLERLLVADGLDLDMTEVILDHAETLAPEGVEISVKPGPGWTEVLVIGPTEEPTQVAFVEAMRAAKAEEGWFHSVDMVFLLEVIYEEKAFDVDGTQVTARNRLREEEEILGTYRL